MKRILIEDDSISVIHSPIEFVTFINYNLFQDRLSAVWEGNETDEWQEREHQENPLENLSTATYSRYFYAFAMHSQKKKVLCLSCGFVFNPLRYEVVFHGISSKIGFSREDAAMPEIGPT